MRVSAIGVKLQDACARCKVINGGDPGEYNGDKLISGRED